MKKVAYILLVVGISVICYSAVTIWQYGKHTDDVVTDVAIVLGAAVWGEEPSPVFQARIDHAISLYEQGLVRIIIFTGGAAEGELAEAEVAKIYARARGIPASAILVETTSTITEENLRNAREVMRANELQQAMIVSDPLHMKRAMLLAHLLEIEAYSSPTETTMYTSLETKWSFLCREVFYYIGTAVTSFRLKDKS